MIECSRCGQETPAKFNFCQSCGYRTRDLRTCSIRLGPGVNQMRAEKIDYALWSGNPAVFAKPGALDYDPSLPV